MGDFETIGDAMRNILKEFHECVSNEFGPQPMYVTYNRGTFILRPFPTQARNSYRYNVEWTPLSWVFYVWGYEK